MTGGDVDGVIHSVWVPPVAGDPGETRCGLLFRWVGFNTSDLMRLVCRGDGIPVTCIGCIGSDKPEYNPWP